MEMLRGHARGAGMSLWRAALTVIAEQTLPKRSQSALRGFVALIERLASESRGLSLHEQVALAVNESGLIAHYAKDSGAEGRIENLEELVSAARDLVIDPDDDLSPLVQFLSYAVLESGEAQARTYEDSVQLMTLHSAKGLEFPVIFLCGLEDGLFPHQRSIGEPDALEEERRLCYVGLTRARREVFMSYAEQRRLHGIDSFGTPSRFIREIPAELVEEVRPALAVSRPMYRRVGRESTPDFGMRLGQRVRHHKFGEGVVLNYEGSGSHARVEVNFATAGTKWLVLAYANLELM